MNPLRTLIILVSCMSAFIPGMLQAGTIYEYVDRDGSRVLTDSPPPGVKSKPVQTYRDLTDADKQELEEKKSFQTKKYQEANMKRKEKEEKLRVAREEYEQAIKNEQRYRANKNQASGYAQQRHWIQKLEEQNKELEEKKKKIQELESEP
jgi:hypothetical protein